MLKSQITVGDVYVAKVNNYLTNVRVDRIRETSYGTRYDVTNMKTGRETMFRSAGKFRSKVG